MANQEQIKILKQGVEVWNKWREENLGMMIDLNGVDLRGTYLSGAHLGGANLHEADLSKANLRGSDLRKTDLFGANLSEADLSGADLNGADLSCAHLAKAILWGVDLGHAKLSFANLNHAILCEADISWANLDRANLSSANLSNANLSRAYLNNADLSRANLSRAILNEGVHLINANLTTANLNGAALNEADLRKANLSNSNLREANLIGENLGGADLRGSDLSKANLTNASLVGTKMDYAKISECSVYGINVWDLGGKLEEQRDLIVSRRGDPIITVDNIKIAQFIYLILNNEEIRDVINTLTSKSVLILGRFSIPERKGILDALRNKLREYDLLPIVFDFDRPADKDFTETIKTLAGLCYFVIADVTNPKSSPLELRATVPDYQIPFVPIIQEGESPFAMMVDLQKKYNWVLNTVTYDSMETLIKVLKPLIIDPAMKKRNELRIIKAQVPEVISGKDFLDKGEKRTQKNEVDNPI